MEKAIDCDLCLYADDSMLLVTGKDINIIESKLSEEMNKIKKWLDMNKLSLHLGKTESIVFGSKRKLNKVSSLNVYCNNIKIESKSNVKYLGVMIDQDLSGKTMGNSIIKRINSGLRFMFRKKEFLKFRERKLLYISLLQSRFNYGYNVYYRNITKCVKNKLQTAQNKIIRYILDFDCRTHLTTSHFRKVNFLDVESRVKYLTLNMMHNIYHGKSPQYLCNFNKVEEVHQHNTRKSFKSYVLPHVNSQGLTSFMYNGAKLWNSLTNNLKSIESKSSFKSNCKLFLFNEMVSTEDSEFVM